MGCLEFGMWDVGCLPGCWMLIYKMSFLRSGCFFSRKAEENSDFHKRELLNYRESFPILIERASVKDTIM